MDDYISYLIIVGTIVIIITLVIFYIMLNYSDSSNNWPPEIMSCPDYWETTNLNGEIQCRDAENITPWATRRAESTAVVTEDDAAQHVKWSNVIWSADGPSQNVDYGDFSCTAETSPEYCADSGVWNTHCRKKKWADELGISWDGITNSTVSCDDDTMFLSAPNNIWAGSEQTPEAFSD